MAIPEMQMSANGIGFMLMSNTYKYLSLFQLHLVTRIVKVPTPCCTRF